MIDNSELIKSLINFNENNKVFLHCQIVQRNKDFPKKKIKEKAIQSYFIRSKEHLDRLMPEIKLLCDFYGARAYISVSYKQFDDVIRNMLMNISTCLCQRNDVNPNRILNKAVGEVKPKYWLVDIDTKDQDFQDNIVLWFNTYFGRFDSDNYWLKAKIPTVQGVHFITKPFNLEEFNKVYPDVMVHKNSMGTLLYMPNICQ